MKKFVLLLFIIFFMSGFCFAAKYKINSAGQIKSEGKIVGTLPQPIYSGVTVPYIDILVDYSGSMESVITKLKSATLNIINSVPKSTAVGLRKVGGDFTCMSTNQLAPVEINNTAKLKAGLNSNVSGNEPFVLGLQKALDDDFSGFDKVTPKKIIMITDGGYTCNEDPCAFARKLMSQRNDIHIDVIYVKSEFFIFSTFYDNAFSCLADITGGSIYKAKDINTLPSILIKSINTVSPEVASQLKTENEKFEFIK